MTENLLDLLCFLFSRRRRPDAVDGQYYKVYMVKRQQGHHDPVFLTAAAVETAPSGTHIMFAVD
jgi:hypothetical protein